MFSIIAKVPVTVFQCPTVIMPFLLAVALHFCCLCYYFRARLIAAVVAALQPKTQTWNHWTLTKNYSPSRLKIQIQTWTTDMKTHERRGKTPLENINSHETLSPKLGLAAVCCHSNWKYWGGEPSSTLTSTPSLAVKTTLNPKPLNPKP